MIVRSPFVRGRREIAQASLTRGMWFVGPKLCGVAQAAWLWVQSPRSLSWRDGQLRTPSKVFRYYGEVYETVV